MTSRALRFGILIRDQLVEERIITKGPITVGQSLRANLSVPVDGVPHEHVLFTETGGGFVLHVPGEPARALEPDTRGKIELGEATILFHEVPAPLPPPPLPASLRNTLAERIDGRLAAIIGASLIAHLGLAVCAWAGDVEVPARTERPLAAPFIQETIEISTAPPPTVSPGPGPAQPAPSRPAPPPRPPRPATHDDATQLAAILTGETAGHGPAEMSRRQPRADLAQQIEDARAHVITLGDADHTSRVDDRFYLGKTLAPELGTLDLSRLPARGDERSQSRLRIGHVEQDEPTSLTPDVVLAKIQRAYLAGLQRCYAQALRDDPALAGKLALSFTVSESGRVSGAQASGLDRDVDVCVEHLMMSWRFAIPHDVHGEPTDADFHISLACQHG